ncbi:MAG: hypothetical protein OZ921_19870 [Sorangiineae bacterium]|nr:hypothetical protein [Polyangiaceae bacterium]MEB2324783.1 hypothetical protein [Sorangiineae bacterium]
MARSGRALVVVGALLAHAACDHRAASSQQQQPSAHRAAPARDAVREAVLRSVCHHSPCGGDSAVVRIYRGPDGAVRKLYRLYGACAHSPGLYFDPDGTLTDTIPERPVVPGSAEAKALEQRHARQVGGLTLAETLRCGGGVPAPP